LHFYYVRAADQLLHLKAENKYSYQEAKKSISGNPIVKYFDVD